MEPNKRVEELAEKIKKVGGFFGLSTEEQAEYRALKPAGKGAASAEVTEVKKEGGLITVTQEQLEQMVNQAVKANIAGANVKGGKLFGKFADWEQIDETNGEIQTATLKIWQPRMDEPRGLIVAQRFLTSRAFDEETRRGDKTLYSIDVMYDDGSITTIEVDARDYAKIQATERVKLIESKQKKLSRTNGEIVVYPKDKSGYTVRRADGGGQYGAGTGDGGFKVDQVETKMSGTFIVERENGQRFEIEDKFLNS